MNKAAIMKEMILRAPVLRKNALHPLAKKTQMRMTQPPLPLTYKLQELDTLKDKQGVPLGVQEDIPFHISRTHKGNLPVYRDYKKDRQSKKTVIRLVQGDIEAFTLELSKVVSNAEVIPKIGRVEIKGLHKESVLLWLKRLGF